MPRNIEYRFAGFSFIDVCDCIHIHGHKIFFTYAGRGFSYELISAGYKYDGGNAHEYSRNTECPGIAKVLRHVGYADLREKCADIDTKRRGQMLLE